MDEMTREYHEAANLFPMMSGEEFEELKADIAANGLREPIWLHPDGRIIDGRNRHVACLETGTPLKFRTWNSEGSLVSFVVSLNLHRRHLSASQRAAIAVDALPLYEVEAADRRAALSGRPSETPANICGGSETGEARELVARDFGTNRQYVSDAKKLRSEEPELFEGVRTGEMTIPQAKKEAKRRKQAPADSSPPSLAEQMIGLSDQERFEKLGWGLRAWDDWRFNECDPRFGDDWPGRIPGQLVGHVLYYYTRRGDLVLDPMAGGGVVPDVCKVFKRKCKAFDLATRPERPEIRSHVWELGNMRWPEVVAPDLIFMDAPYFDKKKSEYAEKASGTAVPVSDLDRSRYLDFFYEFFALASENVAAGAWLAFLNADWYDFQSTPAVSEDASRAITVLDYAELMDMAGWQVVRLIDTPMSSQRFNPGVVAAMQKRRILGTIRRTLIMARAV